MLALADYRCALVIFEERHFRRAAERLGISQPALTARLRRIETTLNARLFERSRAGVEPTDAGLAFVAGARQMLDTAEETEDAVRGARDGLGQTVRVGMTQVSAYQVVIPSLTAFREHHPLARVRLFEATTALLESMLQEKRLDVAFLHPPVHGRGLMEKLLLSVPMDRFNSGGNDQAPLIRYPQIEAPVLMGALGRRESRRLGFVENQAEADTILGAAVLSEAGYGPFAAPVDFPHTEGKTSSSGAAEYPRFETSIAWRSLDRRPIVRSLVDTACLPIQLSTD